MRSYNHIENLYNIKYQVSNIKYQISNIKYQIKNGGKHENIFYKKGSN